MWLAKHAVRIDGIVGVTVGYLPLLNIKRIALRCNAHSDALSGVERRRIHVLPLTARSVSDRALLRVGTEVRSLRARASAPFKARGTSRSQHSRGLLEDGGTTLEALQRYPTIALRFKR